MSLVSLHHHRLCAPQRDTRLRTGCPTSQNSRRPGGHIFLLGDASQPQLTTETPREFREAAGRPGPSSRSHSLKAHPDSAVSGAKRAGHRVTAKTPGRALPTGPPPAPQCPFLVVSTSPGKLKKRRPFPAHFTRPASPSHHGPARIAHKEENGLCL